MDDKSADAALTSARPHDIADRQRAEALLTGQKEVLELIARGAPLDVTLDALSRFIEAEADGMFCSILLVDPDGLRLRHGAAPSLPESYNQAIDGTVIGPNAGSCGTAAYRRAPVIVPDIAESPLWADYRELALAHGLHACWSTPIYGERGELVGTLATYHQQARVPGPRDEELVSIAIYLGGIAIQRQRTEDERMRLLEAEQAARLAAEEAVRLRDEFLSSAAHDLKTPITSIQGQAQLLQRRLRRIDLADRDRERLSGGIRTIETVSGQMTTMIEELQDVAFLQIGRPLELRRQSTDLVALVRDAVEDLKQRSPGHHLTVDTACFALMVEVDPSRMGRVVDNLLANAVKYSPDGGSVTVSLERDGASAVIAVHDQGVGIPAADLGHVFERFRRGTNVAGRFAGTGIGLFGAKQIVEQHGGTMAVDSVEGEGSTFTVRLPL